MERTIVGVLLLTPLLLLLPTVLLFAAYARALQVGTLLARRALLAAALLVPQGVVPAAQLVCPRAFPGAYRCDFWCDFWCDAGFRSARVAPSGRVFVVPTQAGGAASDIPLRHTHLTLRVQRVSVVAVVAVQLGCVARTLQLFDVL